MQNFSENTFDEKDQTVVYHADTVNEYQEYVNSMLRNGTPAGEILTFADYSDKTSQSVLGPKKLLTHEEAALIIQRSWRRHIDMQVYRYYRDLINFRQKGDPASMLRCINPKEAGLLDAAFGAHVKFRLAGERFPPNIYYKIFTHRPIQDLCANSPKDYTVFRNFDGRQLHNNPPSNKLQSGLSKPSSGEWYQRVENNGWRLVSDRMVAHILCDPVTENTSHKPVDFHHSKLKRRQDVEHRRKVRKLEWMRKLYREGMLQARDGSDQETVDLVEGAARGMLEAVEARGTGAVLDWEVDELLNWTTGLNYDDYLVTWKELATTSGSETIVDARHQVYHLVEESPFATSGDARDQSNAQSGRSHNTPVSSLSGPLSLLPQS